MALMIGGFVEAADSDATDGAAFFPEFTNARCFSSKKPAFESGAALSLSLGKKTTTTAQPLKKYVVHCVYSDAVRLGGGPDVAPVITFWLDGPCLPTSSTTRTTMTRSSMRCDLSLFICLLLVRNNLAHDCACAY